MLLLVTLFALLNIFVFAPLLFIGLSYIFSDESFSYRKSLILCLQIIFISLPLQAIQVAISLYLPSISIIAIIILTLATFIIVIYLIRFTFVTTFPKAVLIHIINITVTFLIVFTFKNYVCQAYRIPAGSNFPTLLIGDQILANKYIYRFSQPERNDFIIFKFPQNDRIDYLKRIVALPGEKVKILNKQLFINGIPIAEDFTVFKDKNIKKSEEAPRDNFGPYTVPKDSYFVLGDNRDNSFDSRFWGCVKEDKIKGKAEMIYFSFDKDTKSVRKERIGKKIK